LKFNPQAQWQPHPTEDIIELTRAMLPHEQDAANSAQAIKDERTAYRKLMMERSKHSVTTKSDLKLPAPELNLFKHLLR
jgi:hypothetical protein